jgi:hypothetical protein
LAGICAPRFAESFLGRLLGWQGSTDRTRLHSISLRTGNFMEKFAISGPPNEYCFNDDIIGVGASLLVQLVGFWK